MEEQLARTASANERRKEKKKTAAQLFGLQKTEFNVLQKVVDAQAKRVAALSVQHNRVGSGYTSRV